MRKSIQLFLLCISLSLVLPSCVSKKKFTELEKAKMEADQALAETKSKVKTLEGEMETLQDTKQQLESQNADLNNRVANLESETNTLKASEREAKDALAAQNAKMTSLQTTMKGMFDYEGTGLSVSPRNNRLYVSTGEPILFRSGSTRVQGKYKDQLKNLAEVLKNNPDIKIQVEGHTDSQKMVAGARFMDNWDLSTARAVGVVRSLIKYGVPAEQVAAVGKGEFLPSNTEDTREAREQNRRVEIVIVPDITELYRINQEGV